MNWGQTWRNHPLGELSKAAGLLDLALTCLEFRPALMVGSSHEPFAGTRVVRREHIRTGYFHSSEGVV